MPRRLPASSVNVNRFIAMKRWNLKKLSRVDDP